jgi:hypothetical protein
MESITAAEMKLKELTKAAGQIKREDLPEILRLSRLLLTSLVVDSIIEPLTKRIEVLEETLDQLEKIWKAEADLRKARAELDPGMNPNKTGSA